MRRLTVVVIAIVAGSVLPPAGAVATAPSADGMAAVSFALVDVAGNPIAGDLQVTATMPGGPGNVSNAVSGEPAFFSPGSYEFEIYKPGYHRQAVGPDMGYLGRQTVFNLTADSDRVIAVVLADGSLPLLSRDRAAGTWRVSKGPYATARLKITVAGDAYAPVDRADTLNWRVTNLLDGVVLTQGSRVIAAETWAPLEPEIPGVASGTCTLKYKGRRINIDKVSVESWWSSAPNQVKKLEHDALPGNECRHTYFGPDTCFSRPLNKKAPAMGVTALSVWGLAQPGTLSVRAGSRQLFSTRATTDKFVRMNLWKKLKKRRTKVQLSFKPDDQVHNPTATCTFTLIKNPN